MAIFNNILKTLILSLLSLNVYSQPWLKYYEPWNHNSPGSVISDYDKGFLLSTVGVNNSPHNQHQLIHKLDDNGELLYRLVLGSGLNEQCRFDLFLRDSVKNLIFPGSYHQDGIDPILVKVDSCRNKVWCSRLTNNPSIDFFWDAVTTPDGSIVALSIQNDELNMEAFHIHKFTPDGRQLWRKELASAELHPGIWDPLPVKLMLMPDGGFLVTGYCYWADPGPTPWQYIRSFLVKADSAGIEEWFYVHGINDYVYSSSSVSTIYKGYIYTDGEGYTDGMPYSTPHLFKHDISGNLVYDTRIFVEDYYNRTAKNLCLISKNLDGFFYLVVNMYEYDNSTTDERPATVKIDTTGTVLDFFMPDTALHLNSSGLIEITWDEKLLQPGVIYASGGNDVYMMRLLTDPLRLDSIPWSDFVYDSLCGEEIVTHAISLDNCFIVVNNDDYRPPVYKIMLEMVPYPVPAGEELLIRHTNSNQFRNITVYCYNSFGKVIDIIKINGGTDASKIDISQWSPGIYFAIARSNNTIIGSCKFIKK